jgi:hypothetical protein
MNNKIKSFEDACKALNIEPVLPRVDMLPLENQKAVIANYKLDIIQQAINEGWKPDWNDSNEYKYYPWFKMSSSGVGLSYRDCGCAYSVTCVGSRRVFASSENAKFMGTHFIELYNV